MVESRLIHRGKSEKYYCDSAGNFWEDRGTVRGKKFYVPAPPWAGYINFYLFEGPDIIVEATRKPLCDVPVMKSGGKVTDGGSVKEGGKVRYSGNLILTDEEKDELLRTDPLAEKFIRPYMMGKDFINRKPRWCLWMVGAEPADIRKCPRVLERIERVRQFRLASKKEATRKKAETPMLFDEPVECTQDYIAVPVVSSERRKYIPMEWVSRDIVPGSHIKFIENATLYQFGIMTSSVHMSWVRIVSGRLKSDYSYSNTIDYNCFPWPECPAGSPMRASIERTAQAILDARALYPRSSLADLYDERTMPPELRKAHNANDEAVMAAYGFSRHYEDARLHDEDIATNLLYMYKDLSGCTEYVKNYPNLELWEEYYGEYGEDGDDC